MRQPGAGQKSIACFRSQPEGNDVSFLALQIVKSSGNNISSTNEDKCSSSFSNLLEKYNKTQVHKHDVHHPDSFLNTRTFQYSLTAIPRHR